jgi:glycosyltransferase involved in cell wall biosynthesis
MISVVIPIYNEEENISVLHTATRDAMNATGEEWEIIYVNDGSRDRSLTMLLEEQTADPRVVVVNLSRNWGHQGAITAGLRVASGDAVVLMDGDLQDHPSNIPAMVEKWRDGVKVVVAERLSRRETGLRGLLFPLFYRVLGKLTDFPVPLNAGIFGLIDRKVVDAINALPENNRYIPGLKALVGYRTETIYYDRMARNAGEAKQTFGRLFKYATDAIYSFSYKPLRLALAVGFALSLAGCFSIFAGAIAGLWLHRGMWFAGAAGVGVVLLLSSLQLVCIGFVGEYVGRVYDEVRQRPLFIIDEVLRANTAAALAAIATATKHAPAREMAPAASTQATDNLIEIRPSAPAPVTASAA